MCNQKPELNQKPDKNAPIGVFDSGVGGLTVAREIMRQMPEERIVYFGDTARVPYGSKSQDTIIRYSRQIIRFLMTKHVKAIVIACNTASAYALATVEKEFDVPIIGVIRAGARTAVQVTRNGKIGVIATEGTIGSGIYTQEIKKLRPDIEVTGKPCPLFVPLAEEGWTDNEVSRQAAKRYLEELVATGIDSLVLGCTHYPLLKRCIGQTVGEAIKLVDPAKATARRVMAFLKEHDLLNESEGVGEKQFYLSDSTDTFRFVCQKALKHPYEPEIIDIEMY